MLRLRGHRRWVLKFPSEVRHNNFHLCLADAFSPDGVSARQQIVHYDTCGPNVCFLSVSKDVGNLFGRLVKKSATLRKVCNRVHGILDGQTKVDKFYTPEVLVAAQDNIVGLDVTMNHILNVM